MYRVLPRISLVICAQGHSCRTVHIALAREQRNIREGNIACSDALKELGINITMELGAAWAAKAGKFDNPYRSCASCQTREAFFILASFKALVTRNVLGGDRRFSGLIGAEKQQCDENSYHHNPTNQ